MKIDAIKEILKKRNLKATSNRLNLLIKMQNNGKNQFDDINENKIHEESFKKLKKILNKKFPKFYLEFYLMNLKSSMKRFNV